MARKDIHRPSAIIPEDYDFVGFECVKVEGLADAYFLLEERARINAHKARTGGKYSGHEHGGNCGICGNANAIYTVLFYHAPTNTYVRTGQECAEKLDCGAGFEVFRTSCKAALDRKAGKEKARALLDAENLGAAWDVYAAEGEKKSNDQWTVTEIVGNVVRYGRLSEAQANYLRTLLDRIARAPEIAAQRAAEREAAKPVPITEERVVVRGKILSIRYPDQGCGGDPTKCLVQTDDGWKVWGTLPRQLDDAERGAVIEFSAKIAPSQDDPKFGFFSRPTKPRLITEGGR